MDENSKKSNVVLLTVIAIVVLSALVGVILAQHQQNQDLEIKANRYEELYHDLMNVIEKPY